jgi:hypothetical protein
MAAKVLVDSRIDDGQRIVDQLLRDGCEVLVAFWLKSREHPSWRFYIAAPMLDADGPGHAYGAVYAAIGRIPDSSVQLHEVTLLNSASPIAQDAVKLRLKYAGKMPTRFPGKRLGDLSIERVYFYPLPSKKEITVYGLFYKGEPHRAVHLSLEPQDPNSRLVIERMGQRLEYPADTSLSWGVTVPEGSLLERDKTGQFVLAWDQQGHRLRSDANEVLSFARAGLYGFRLVRTPT